MGISRWFGKRSVSPGDHSPFTFTSPLKPARGVVRRELAGEPVKMTGTTTFGAAAAATFQSRGLVTGGPLELAGQLVSEPENPADPNAVAVHVDGAKVGYLPGFVAAQIGIGPDEVLDCQLQMWAADDRGKTRVIGWIA